MLSAVTLFCFVRITRWVALILYFSRVVYHGVTSSFFGIGILLVSDLLGGWYFWSVLLIWWELLFSAKGGLAVSKRGPVPPFFSKRGPVPPF